MYTLSCQAYDSDINRVVGTLDRPTRCRTRESANRLMRRHVEHTKLTFPWADHFVCQVKETVDNSSN